ncbi:TPA: ribosome recycling factor [Candidatus Uhrbacteria bacterium]|nr:ribosome recycling factor [Candidatus Uhrbacteria bacterium]
MHQFLSERKPELEKAIDFLEVELAGIQTGRASTGLVEGVSVLTYGASQDLKNLAAISTPDAHTVQIEPWDASIVKDIEKALAEANLGMMPNVSGKIIRMIIQPLTEDRRKELSKMVGKKVEEARIRVRTARDEVKKSIEKAEKEKEIGEDERYRLQEELDAFVKEVNDSLDRLGRLKEEQIMKV